MQEGHNAVVVDDADDIRALLVEVIRQAGFTVHEAADGAQALRLIAEYDPDVVTLDLELPDMHGIEVCRRLRRTSDAYVIMVTASPDEVDRLMGLEIGADDYLTKPFNPRELRARIAAMMRRPRRPSAAPPQPEQPEQPESDADAAESLTFGDLHVDVEGRVATLDGAELVLTRTEFDLLTTLLSNPRRVWTRESLLRLVWGSEWANDGHLVEVHMGNLRRKLGDDPKTGRYIRTVRSVGYRMGGG